MSETATHEASRPIDTMSPSEIKAVQGDLLAETLEYAYRHSPYYSRVLKERGLRPSDISGVDALAALPLTSRQDLQQHNWEFLATPKGDIAELVATSGTTGEPAFVAMTRSDLERLARNEEMSFGYAGVSRGDRFHIAVTCDNLFIAGVAYYSGLLRRGATVMRVGPRNMLRHLDIIERMSPTGIVAVPSFIVQMIRRMEEQNRDVAGLGIKKIVLIGDSIRNADLGSNTLGDLIERSFGRVCYSTYGITEGQLSFCECGQFQGLHSHPEFVIAEIVDDAGACLPDGAVGELVLTPLGIKGMPLIRYRTGDMTFRIAEPCACGRNSVRIGAILGRKNQRLKVKGVTLYPKTLENAILSVKEIVNYQIEVSTGDDLTDRIVLRVGATDRREDLLPMLHETLQAKARVTPIVEIEAPEKIEKRIFEDGGRKALVFKDRRITRYE